MYFIASDHAGFELKESIKQWFINNNLEVCDLGVESKRSVDYPDYASLLCKEVAKNSNNYGILICGSGIGMSISANKHKSIRAALCVSSYMAKMARAHNDANVLCLGARVSGIGEVESMLEAFINTTFEANRHVTRVAKLQAQDK